MKRIIGIILVVAFVATSINDIGRYFTTRYYLDQQTSDIARFAADELHRTQESRDVVGGDTANYAAQQGVQVTAYDQTVTNVTVFTRTAVKGTWVLARAHALLSKLPSDAPLYVSDSQTAFLQ